MSLDTSESAHGPPAGANLEEDLSEIADSNPVLEPDGAEINESGALANSDENGVDNEGDDDSNDSASDSESESDESNSDGSNANNISDYEKLRAERIRRNQEYLAKLGLEGKNGGGVLGGKQKRKKRSEKQKTELVPKRQSLGRSSKKEVNYNNEIDLRLLKVKAKDPRPRKERAFRKDRVPVVVYKEFQRIRRERKWNFKMLKKYSKTAEREVRYWNSQLVLYNQQQDRQQKMRKLQEQQAEERRLLGGKTKFELLQEIDRRKTDLWAAIYEYDQEKQAIEQRKEENERKIQEQKRLVEMNAQMEMIDALDMFPKSLNQITKSLNEILVSRSPKDPPPPRRSSRGNSTSISTPDSKKKGSKESSNPRDPDSPSTVPSWSRVASAVLPTIPSDASGPDQVQTDETINVNDKSDIVEGGKASSPNPRQNRKNLSGRNVGGWISPPFADSIDRSWLSKESVATPSLQNLKDYVPQNGHIVLYYPGNHQAFLKVHPDFLGNKLRNLLRTPLWVRAQRSANRVAKDSEAAADAANVNVSNVQQEKESSRRPQRKRSRKSLDMEESTIHPETKKNPSVSPKDKAEKDKSSELWWTEEWIQGVDSEMGQYPIICRVERTHAEFPYDQNLQYRKVNSDGSVTWAIPNTTYKAGKTKKAGEREAMRLCVLLRPLTPVVPPNGAGCEDELRPPPTFTVVTFPTKQAQPFLVPFSWAYCLNHSLTMNESVMLSNTQTKARVSQFLDVGENTFRLDDKVAAAMALLEELPSEAAIEGAISNLKSPSLALPMADAMVVVEFIRRFYRDRSVTNKIPKAGGQGKTTNLMEFIRTTLPLARGIGIRRQSSHRKLAFEPFWNLTKSQGKTAEDSYQAVSSKLGQGVPYRLDDSIRFKIKYTMEEILETSPELSIFIDMVSEAVAPSYYCAVPIGMHFGRILERLKVGKFNQCYYTSVESILGDIQSIIENCILYNSPESPLVDTCLRFLPMLKKRIFDIHAKHVKEMRSRAQGMSTGSSAENSRRKKTVNILDSVNVPYSGLLDRSWLQSTYQDSSWNMNTSIKAESRRIWSPQVGDDVLYSRSLHKEFVKSNATLLAPEQMDIPSLPYDISKNTGEEEKPTVFPDSNDPDIDDSWLQATVLHVRATFPSNTEGEKDSNLPLPVLVLRLQFPYSWWKEETFEICWQPKTSILSDSDGEARMLEALGFLKPAWAINEETKDVLGGGQILQIPNFETSLPDNLGIERHVENLIGRCFDVLKRRCLKGIDPDTIDQRLCLENARLVASAGSSASGARSLPSFESLFTIEEKAKPTTQVGTRGVRKVDDDKGIPILSEMHFLPLWVKDTLQENAKNGNQNFESVLVSPNLCLELIRIRVKHGYYRHKAAIINDLQEAYVTSALFLLFSPASRRKHRVSIRRIAKHLQSAKGNERKSFLPRPQLLKKKLKKKSSLSSSELEKAIPTLSTPKNVVKATDDVSSDFTDEEKNLISKISKTRKLYSMAILAVQETEHVARLFRLSIRKSSSEKEQARIEQPSHLEVDHNLEKDAAARQIRYLLSAVGNDVRRNHFRSYGFMKFKISVEGKTVARIASQLTMSDGTKVTGKPVYHQQFAFGDFERNDALAQVMFRRPGRRSSCVRCQVSGLSFYSCRVRQCHSNPDFDFVANLSEFGGVNKLLEPFMKPNELDQGHPGHTQASNVKTVIDETQIEAKSPAKIQDPSQFLEKARDAVRTSTMLYRQMATTMDRPARLGATFIRETFPIDPSDGHYLWCIICGLSGDVLCCDGCSNVVHQKCVGLLDIPEGDWFCRECHAKKQVMDSSSVTSGVGKSTIPDQEASGGESPSMQASVTKNIESKPLEQVGISQQPGQNAQNNASELQPQVTANPSTEPQKSTTEQPIQDDEKITEEVAQIERTLRDLQALREPLVVPARAIQVGARFMKAFDGQGKFEGQVKSLPTSDHKFYKVEYEDGDAEDLDEKELLDLIKASAGHFASKDKAPALEEKEAVMADSSRTGTRGRRRQGAPNQLGEEVADKKPIEKRKRGRPRKNIAEVIGGGTPKPSSETPKRRPGRPRKIREIENVDVTEGHASAERGDETALSTKRKRGRPRKASILEQPVLQRKRGRKAKEPDADPPNRKRLKTSRLARTATRTLESGRRASRSAQATSKIQPQGQDDANQLSTIINELTNPVDTKTSGRRRSGRPRKSLKI